MNHLMDDAAIAGMLGELHLLRVQREMCEIAGVSGSGQLAALRATVQMCEEIAAVAMTLAQAETPEAEQQVRDALHYWQRAVRLLRESGRCDISVGDGVFVALDDLVVALDAIIIERDPAGRRARSGT